MSFPELLEAIRNLPRADKIRLMHELVDQVSTSDNPEAALVSRIGNADIISPIPAPEAAAALAALLERERSS
jgi:hypothetical protein